MHHIPLVPVSICAFCINNIKDFHHIPVAEYNCRSKKRVRMVQDRLNTCACIIICACDIHTQSVVGKGSL